MEILSQNDPRWKNTKLGTSNATIGSDGCAITCVAMLAGTTPDKVNARMPFIEENLIVWVTAAQQWGLKYANPIISKTPAFYPVIAHVKLSGYDHYIVVDSDGSQYDPWTGTVSKNKYAIIDYRNLTKEGGRMVYDDARLQKEFDGIGKYVRDIWTRLNNIEAALKAQTKPVSTVLSPDDRLTIDNAKRLVDAVKNSKII